MFPGIMEPIQGMIDQVRPMAQSAGARAEAWAYRIVQRLDDIAEAVQSAEFTETRLPSEFTATGTGDIIDDIPPGDSMVLESITLGDAPARQLFNGSIPAVSTASGFTIDVSLYDTIKLLVWNTDFAATGNDVDVFLNAITAAGNNIPGSTVGATTFTGSLSGGTTSKWIVIDTRGMDFLRLFPRNNNATVPLTIQVDLIPVAAWAAIQVGGGLRFVAAMRSTTKLDLPVSGGSAPKVYAPAGTPVYAVMRQRRLSPHGYSRAPGMSPATIDGDVPPNIETSRHVGTWQQGDSRNHG